MRYMALSISILYQLSPACTILFPATLGAINYIGQIKRPSACLWVAPVVSLVSQTEATDWSRMRDSFLFSSKIHSEHLCICH